MSVFDQEEFLWAILFWVMGNGLTTWYHAEGISSPYRFLPVLIYILAVLQVARAIFGGSTTDTEEVAG